MVYLVSAEVERDGDLWFSYCKELDIASCGNTEREARCNLEASIRGQLGILDRKGLLEKRLAACHNVI